MSFMRKHQQRLQNGEAPTAVAPEPYAPARAMATPANALKLYKLQLASVQEDCKRISELNSREARNRLKQGELIEKYAGYIQAYIESGLNHPNEVLTTYIVWLFDVHSIELGLKLALFAIEQKQAMPARYNRDLTTFVADELFDWAEVLMREGHSAEPYFGQVFELISTGLWNVHEAVQAKYWKLAGLWAEHDDNPARALECYEKAQTLDPKRAKVKTRVAQLKNQLEKV